jgi:capsular exopolysaccharide synthesis family protein
VVVLSGDLRDPSVESILGVHGGPGLSGILTGRARLEDALRLWNRPGLPLEVLPAGQLPVNPSELLGSARMTDLMRQLEDHAAYVIVDAPPVLAFTDAAVLGALASGVLLAVRSDETRVDDVVRATDALGRVGARLLGAVVTMTPRHGPDARPDPRRSSGFPLAGRVEVPGQGTASGDHDRNKPVVDDHHVRSG